MNNLMVYWAEAFKQFHPDIDIQIEGKGSGSAPAALIAGTAQLAPMSRPLKETELDQFENTYGYPPTVFRVALDAVVVFVNLDNPLRSISLPQLDAIFSRTRYRGFRHNIRTWHSLRLGGAWAVRPISTYGRNSASGTYGYFKEHVLLKGDFKNNVKEQLGSAAVVQAVSEEREAIGYSGIGFITSGVHVLSVRTSDDAVPVAPTTAEVVSGEYPLSRFLYIVVNKPPRRPPDPLVAEFLRFILSREGQQMVIKDGYVPLSAALAFEESKKLF